MKLRLSRALEVVEAGSGAFDRSTASASGLQALQELVVIGVGADPEPDPHVVVASGEGPVVPGDTCRVDRLSGMDLFELKRRLGWPGF